MIHLYYTYSVSKLPYRRAFISATSNREFPPDFLKSFYKEHLENEKGAVIPMDSIVFFTVGFLIGVAIHSYIKKRKD